MRSKTSFFSPAIFKKNITRFWLLVVLYLVAQCLALPLVMHTNLSYTMIGVSHNEAMYNAVRDIYQITEITNVIAFFGACASAMAVFSYLYSARSANMMAALPVRRESMFISSCAAIYAVVIAVNLLAVAMTFCIGLAHGLSLMKWLVEWFFIVMGQFTLYFGMAVLCANMTGNILAMPVIYGVMNFCAVCVGSVAVEIANEVIYGLNAGLPDLFAWLTPFVWLLQGGYEYTGPSNVAYELRDYSFLVYDRPTAMILYTIAGVVFLLIAFFIHRKRAMETAGDVVSVRILRPVFKILCAFAAGMGFGTVFFYWFLNYQGTSGAAYRLMASIFVFGFVGYVLADMLVRKTTRIPLAKTAVPALIMSCAMALTIFVMDSDMLGIESKVPEIDQVKQANVSCSGEGLTFTDPEGIGWVTAVHHTVLDNKAKNENDLNNHDMTIHITYTMQDDSQVRRYYRVRYEVEGVMTPEAQIVDELFNDPENILIRKETDIPMTEENVTQMRIYHVVNEQTGEMDSVEFSAQEAWELYNQCIYPDMLDGNIGLVNIGNSMQKYQFYNNEIEIYLFTLENPKGDEADGPTIYYHDMGYPIAESYRGSSDSYEERFYTYPTPESHRTNAWLESHGINLSKDYMF